MGFALLKLNHPEQRSYAKYIPYVGSCGQWGCEWSGIVFVGGDILGRSFGLAYAGEDVGFLGVRTGSERDLNRTRNLVDI